MAYITEAEVAQIKANFWLNAAIGRFNEDVVMIPRVRTDLGTEIRTKGESVTIPKRGNITVREKTAGNNYTTDNPTSTGIQVALDTVDYAQWGIEDVAADKAVSAGYDYLADAVPQLVEKVEGKLIGLYPEVGTVVGTAGTPLTKSTLLQVRRALRMQAKSQGQAKNFSLLLNIDAETELFEIDDLVRYDATGKDGAIVEGMIGKALGMSLFSSVLMPELAGPPVTRYSMAFHRDAFALVSRPMSLPPAGAGVISATMTDAQSGLAYRFVEFYDANAGAMVRRVEILYGVKAIQEDVLAVLLQN